jgi:hypothetical protein
MKVAPGPVYHEVIQELRDGWLDGSIHSSAEEKQALLRILDQRGISHG